MIGISGLARSGKNTLADSLAPIIEQELKLKVKFYSFAEALRKDCDTFLIKNLGISAFSEEPEEKKYIRSILVAYGESMKSLHGKEIWADRLKIAIESDISKEKLFPIITDVRFDFEADMIKEEFGGAVVHISREGNEPPNEIEKLNDPLVSAKADIKHFWPTFGENKIENAKDHAIIIWQMLKEAFEEKWMT